MGHVDILKTYNDTNHPDSRAIGRNKDKRGVTQTPDAVQHKGMETTGPIWLNADPNGASASAKLNLNTSWEEILNNCCGMKRNNMKPKKRLPYVE